MMPVNRPRKGGLAIITDISGNFLLQRRDDLPGIICPGMIGLFGGHREGDESFLQCAVRELQEELSYPFEPSMFQLLEVYAGPNHDAPGETLEAHLFLVRNIEAKSVSVTEGALAIMTAAEVRSGVKRLTPMTAMALKGFLGRPGG